MKKIVLTGSAILALIVLVLLLIQSQSPPSLPAQASPTRVVSESIPTRPAPSTHAPSTSNGLTPPSLLYLTENRLYQQEPDGTRLMIAGLGDEGDVMSAIKLKDTVFVLRQKGLQRVELEGGNTEMVVRFDSMPLSGELIKTSNDNVVLYSIALDSDCSSTGIGSMLGLYQIDNRASRPFFAKDEHYIQPVGLTADKQSVYGFPRGCAPGFGEFWLISTDKGEITSKLLIWDATSKEAGVGNAALSPDARFLAFGTSLVETEDSVRYRLSIYDLEDITIERHELPNPPSHIGDGLLWSPNNQRLYFVLNPGSPYDEPSYSYGLWNLDIQTGIFSQVTSLHDPYMHLVSISSDGQWMLLLPEALQSVTYVHLPTGEQVAISLPPGGVNQIVP